MTILSAFNQIPWPEPIGQQIGWFGMVLEEDRDLRKIIAASRARLLDILPLPLPRAPHPSSTLEHRPIDVAHWAPNMPRGAEQM